jgi:hypothetical protein
MTYKHPLGDWAAWDWIPNMPTTDRLKPAVMPRPPKLKETMTAEETADRCWDAYAAVCDHFGYKSYRKGFSHSERNTARIRARGKHRSAATVSPAERILRDGARGLMDMGFAPMAWVKWSFDVWNAGQESRGKKAAAPPVSWVFNPTRMHERRGWFEKDAAIYDFKWIQQVPESTALCRRWNDMRTDLLCLKDPDEQSVRALVREHFPEGWDLAYCRAMDANNAHAQKLREAAIAGRVYLWDKPRRRKAA